MGSLSYWEHQRSPRPSSLLTLYLLAAALLNAARCRTLWHMPSSDRVLITFIVTTVLMGVALGLEVAPKDSILRDEIERPSPEERRGIVERSILTWIIPTFAYGYRHTFTSTSLPSVDTKLTKCRLKETAITSTETSHTDHWETDDRLTSFIIDLDQSLFYSLLQRHWQDLLSPIIPRTCFLALTLAQSFLVSTATAWISNPTSSQYFQKRGALIGAYALVYLGLAVSLFPLLSLCPLSDSTFWQVTFALYRQKANRAATAMRASLTDYIFQRLSHLDSATELAGSATTLVSADIERIQFAMRYIHEIWSNLVTVAIALWLIERAIGVAMVPALGIAIGTYNSGST